jgi:hypothetical protein
MRNSISAQDLICRYLASLSVVFPAAVGASAKFCVGGKSKNEGGFDGSKRQFEMTAGLSVDVKSQNANRWCGSD